MEAEQKVTWDCIWFGSYPQAEVVTKAMKKADAISGLKGYSDYYNWTDSKTITIFCTSLLSGGFYLQMATKPFYYRIKH